jgi:hypothetical protein
MAENGHQSVAEIRHFRNPGTRQKTFSVYFQTIT